MNTVVGISLLFCAQAVAVHVVDNLDIDPKFGVNTESLRLDEIAKTVKDLNTAVMGIAESREKLARKTEQLLSIQNNPKVEKAKQEIEKQVEYNFLKTLSPIALKRPVRAQAQQEAVFKVLI